MKSPTALLKKLIFASPILLLLSLQATSAYYDPGPQRWLNRDPLAEEWGYNLFTFVHGSPLMLVDTDGRGWWPFSKPTPKPPPAPPAAKPPPAPAPKPPSQWLSGKDCTAWGKDPTPETCADCCIEQMCRRQARDCPALEMKATKEHCLNKCESTGGRSGPTR